MPMPTEPADGAPPSDLASDPTAGNPPAPSSPAPMALVREVHRPTADRGRVAGLAMVCSAAGVALGFALAGSLFAAMAPPRAGMGPAGYSACTGHRSHGHGGGYHLTARAARPWLGVTVNVAGDSSPAVLTGVFAGAPAAEAGLRAGDRITHFAGQPIDSANELLGLIRERRPGDMVAVEALGRDGRQLTIPGLRLGTMPVR